jgi:hypothetical protein
MRYQGVLVVIDGTRPDQVEWFKRSEYASDIFVKLLITNGGYYDLSTQLKRPVFYAIPEIVQKFRLSYVPSVISQKQSSNLMEVKEIGIKSEKD